MLLEISRQADADLSQILRTGFDSFGPIVARDYHFVVLRILHAHRDVRRAFFREHG